MSGAYGKGARGKATRLHSLLVRARGSCEACGYTCPCPTAPASHTADCKLQCAHIIGRARVRTRTDLANAVALCSGDHRRFTSEPIEWGRWVDAHCGPTHIDLLRARADEGTGQRLDWDLELARLTHIWAEVVAAGGLTASAEPPWSIHPPQEQPT